MYAYQCSVTAGHRQLDDHPSPVKFQIPDLEPDVCLGRCIQTVDFSVALSISQLHPSKGLSCKSILLLKFSLKVCVKKTSKKLSTAVENCSVSRDSMAALDGQFQMEKFGVS
jgi:hypothetical protein